MKNKGKHFVTERNPNLADFFFFFHNKIWPFQLGYKVKIFHELRVKSILKSLIELYIKDKKAELYFKSTINILNKWYFYFTNTCWKYWAKQCALTWKNDSNNHWESLGKDFVFLRKDNSDWVILLPSQMTSNSCLQWNWKRPWSSWCLKYNFNNRSLYNFWHMTDELRIMIFL